MRRSLGSATLVSILTGWLITPAFGHGNNNNGTSSVSVAPAPHHAAAPAVMPSVVGSRFYSGQSFSGQGYHPMIASGKLGNGTFQYPGVRNSTVHHLNQATFNKGNGLVTMRSNDVSHLNAFRHLQARGNSASDASLRGDKLDPQTSSRLRTWNGKIDSAGQARFNHAQHAHHHHDCNWWRHRCAAIVFLDWGWWGWYDGWWYPAWGYDPYYSYYEYDEPIYGYSGLSPDQIVANVQSALQQQGYYNYAVDGKMGALTRSAIARYQRDRLLPITYGIAPATLGSLGLVGR